MGGLLAVDEVLHEKHVGVGGGAIAFLKDDINFKIWTQQHQPRCTRQN